MWDDMSDTPDAIKADLKRLEAKLDALQKACNKRFDDLEKLIKASVRTLSDDIHHLS